MGIEVATLGAGRIFGELVSWRVLLLDACGHCVLFWGFGYRYTCIYIYTHNIYLLPRTQMTHILEDSTHKMEGQPPEKEVKWVLGIYIYICVHIMTPARNRIDRISLEDLETFPGAVFVC